HPINHGILFETILEDLVAEAITDRAGRFTMLLPRGAHANLNPRHPRHVGPSINVAPDIQALKPVVLEPAGSLVGRVIDAATGRPVAGAYVVAQLVEFRPRVLSGTSMVTASDDRGRFVLGGAEPGVYNVLFHGVPGRPDVTACAAEGVRVRAGADSPADLTVIEGRPLRGVVVDRETDQPVPGIRVGCYGPARPRSGAAVESHLTDDRGRFTFHVPPGEQYVYLQEGAFDNRLARQTIVIPEQGKIEFVRLMRRGAQKRGMMGMMEAAPHPRGRANAAPPPPT